MKGGSNCYFLVLSQAKTGTTTLGEVLPTVVPEGAYLGKFHNHRLRPVDPSTMSRNKYAVRQRDLGILDRIRGLDPASSKLVVITAVRDPVERMYSHFFEQRVYTSEQLRGTAAGDWCRERFVETFRPMFQPFLKSLLRGELSFLHHVLNDGLALEFPNLGFEGIAAGLARIGPYARYSSGAVTGLLLPSRDLIPALRRALADLDLDVSGMAETVANSADERGFAELYRAFMDEVPFHKRYRDWAYMSPMPRLLYTPAEIEVLRQGWTERWAAAMAERRAARAPSPNPAAPGG